MMEGESVEMLPYERIAPGGANSWGYWPAPPVAPTGEDQMSVDVKTEIVISRPVDVVASYAADPSNAPEWYVNIESVDWETSPPVAAGSRLTFVARFMGRRLEYTYEVAELVPGERLVMRTAEGPFPMRRPTPGRRSRPMPRA